MKTRPIKTPGGAPVSWRECIVLLDNQPVAPDVTRNEGFGLLRLFIALSFLERLSLCRRGADGSLLPVQFSELDLTGIEAPLGTATAPLGDELQRAIRLAAGRRYHAARAANPPVPTPPSEAQRLRDTQTDLARQQREAEERVLALRETRERHAQLVAAGDVNAANELVGGN